MTNIHVKYFFENKITLHHRPFLECCKSIYVSGGIVNTSRVLDDRNGEYVHQYSGRNNESLYVLLCNSSNSSIALGDDGKGWRVRL